MPSFTEVSVILAVILGIFLLPRMLNRQPEDRARPSAPVGGLSGWMRLFLALSIVWPVALALYLKPWDSGWPVFLYAAAGPLVVAWGTYWVVSGFKKGRK